MLARVFSAAVQGVEAFEIEIEVNAAKGGDPCVIIVGLPDAAVKESKDRVHRNPEQRLPLASDTLHDQPCAGGCEEGRA